MKLKILCLMLAALFLFAGVAAAEKPVIRADKTYYDVNTGLYVLRGNVHIEVRDRIITAGQARVSMSSLEVWGSGGVTVTQGDIYFNGDSVYVYGLQNRAQIDGGVVFKRTALSIIADKADFNWGSKLATFTGNVTVTQGEEVWKGDSVGYNVETNTVLQ